MPKQITKFKCDFCRRSYVRIKDAKRHELLCFYNPDRAPKAGELATFDNLPSRLRQVNSYGIPNSEWEEPKEKYFDVTNDFETTFKWWPKDSDGELKIGMFWDGSRWLDIPGYKPPNFSPGHCWKNEVIPVEFYIDSEFY